ncbi:MAG: phage tail tape measure protein [Hyphomicrobium sp.]
MADVNDPVDSMTVTVLADTTQFQQQINDASRLGRQFGTTLTSAFDGIAIKGKGVTDVLRSLALNLSQLVLNATLKPLTSSIGSGLASLVGSNFGFAAGGVIQQRMPMPFADGGVISSPVTFPLTGGNTGLAGEAGSEAIMPLTRGPDGRLGVAAQGGGGVNVTFNVSTPDADSFRRSEAQVTAMVARAAALGQRNL